MSSSVPGFFTCGAVALNVMYRGTGYVCVWGGGGGDKGESEKNTLAHFTLLLATHRSNKLEYKL